MSLSRGVSKRTQLLLSKCVNDVNFDNEAKPGPSNCNKTEKKYTNNDADVFYPPIANETGTSENYVNSYKYEKYFLSLYGMFQNDLSEQNFTFLDDSDDSVKDPNYESEESSDSEEDNNFNTDISSTKKTQNISIKTSVSLNQTKTSKKQKKQERKACRNTGKAYVTAKNKKLVRERKIQPLKTNCRRRCKEKVIDEAARNNLFNDYWNMGSYDRRVSYIASLIKCEDKKIATLRTNSTKSKNREKTFSYFLDINNERIQVCKECFSATFNETNKFILFVTKKKLASHSGIPECDKRGKHAPSHKISEVSLKLVIDHINRFPAYESHYSRRHTDKKYLPSDLTKSKMYNLYREEQENNGIKPVSIKIYSQTVDKLNLKFKKPSNDTCNTCDVLHMKIQSCSNQETRDNLRDQLSQHHAEAERAYECKRQDKIFCESSPKTRVIVFDLQQVLPTPYLTTGKVFYKRQLHTYNLTIHDCVTQKSFHFMWHEAIGARGANEIASCLYKYLTSLKETEHVICYSDTCGGQNKNSHVTAMFSYVVSESKTIKTIEHKFLIPGHTHMECDSDHAIIEKTKKRSPFNIHLPRDWYNLVRLAGSKRIQTKSNQQCDGNKFTVIEMKREDFFDFAALLKGPLVNRKMSESKEKFSWRPVKWLKYEKDFGIVKFKNNLEKDSLFETINLKRKSSHSSASIGLNILYDSDRQIEKKKKVNLLEILELIDESAKPFYKNLKSSTDDGRDVDPDIDSYFTDDEF